MCYNGEVEFYIILYGYLQLANAGDARLLHRCELGGERDQDYHRNLGPILLSARNHTLSC